MKTQAKRLSEKSEAGEDITRFLEITKARRPGYEQRRMNAEFQVWMIESLDLDASRDRYWGHHERGTTQRSDDS